MAAHTEASIRIDAPFDVVWAMTNDVAAWPELYTEYAKTEILHSEGNTVRFRLTMHPDEKGNAWNWVSERTFDKASRTVQAHRVETGWFEHMNIHWAYVDHGARATTMTWVQDFAMRADSPLDDGQMSAQIRRNSATQMAVIKERVEAAYAAVTPAGPYRVLAAADVAVNRRRGGEVRTVLGPGTVGSTTGFMGTATIAPGDRIAEHYHPYSEEFLYLVRGELTVDLEGEPVPLAAGQGLFIPVNTRHRLRNTGAEEASAVFHIGPLAPRPDLGHVDTERLEPAEPAPSR